jgi:serine phosphatase RsbU (regulator of sigma subunit)
MSVLHQSASENTGKFGMDIALAVFNPAQNELLYSGAHNPLVIIRNGNMNEYKPEKISIGASADSAFASISIPVQKGDVLYLFSDGFQDQIGGEKRKKFLAFNLREFFLKIHAMNMDAQKEALDKQHLEWKGTNEQTDDILIIGIKI